MPEEREARPRTQGAAVKRLCAARSARLRCHLPSDEDGHVVLALAPPLRDTYRASRDTYRASRDTYRASRHVPVLLRGRWSEVHMKSCCSEAVVRAAGRGAGRYARTHAGTQAGTHARTHAGRHARTHARRQADRQRAREPGS
eukprot:6192386-Pleurochrysis_carterae.AAC.3